MYKVCTCPQSNLTGGDPNCPVHGYPAQLKQRDNDATEALFNQMAKYEVKLKEKDERIRGLEDTMVRILKSSDVSWYTGKHGGHDWREAVDEAHLLLVKIERHAREGKDDG